MTRIVVHVIESFSGGSLDVVRALARISVLPSGEPVRHVVVHGHRPDSPADPRQGFGPEVELHPWAHAVRPIRPWQDVAALLSLLAVLRRCGEIDILHLHSSKAGFVGRMAAFLLGFRRRTVYTPHGVASLRQDIGGGQRRFYEGLERLASRLAGVVVACSGSEAALLRATGIPARQINNGVADPGAPREGLRPRTVINVGRVTAQKDPAFFAELARRARQDGLPYEFVWVGAGEDEALLMDAPVRVTGWISPVEVALQLRGADVFLSTSRWEGLSLAVLQAMGMGLPLLLRTCPGNLDLVEDGAATGFDNVEAALARLEAWQRDSGALQVAGQLARQAFVARYSEASMLAGYAALYEELMR